MTRITVNIDNSKSEKVILAVIQALGLSYEIEHTQTELNEPLNKSEQVMYNRLEESFRQIKLHQQGKIELKAIEAVLAELS